MLISDLFERLSLGELSNLAISNNGDGTIVEAKKPVLINFVNAGLLQLFTKFNMRQNDCIIVLQEGVTNYHLLKRFAENAGKDSNEDVKYILDLPNEPFDEDVIKILEVVDPHGTVLALNDQDKAGVFTPQFNILNVPNVIPKMALNVIYQARHPLIDRDTKEGLIDIPYVFEEALVAYVAYKLYTSMNTDTSTAKAQEYLSLFNSICDSVTIQDAVSVTVSNTGHRFKLGGWV